MLAVDSVSLRFNGLTVLDDLHLKLGRHDVLGLIGPNGSGKSSLLNVISGNYTATNGQVLFKGQDISKLECHEISALGIARTVQTTRLFERLPVLDNVWPISKLGRAAAMGLLEQVGLADRAQEMAGSLSFAERRRLDLARALALSPKLLLLDEPASALTATESEAMAELLSKIALPGRAVIIVEHKIDMIAALCPRVAVLHLGRKIFEGTPDAVRDQPSLRKIYFGGEATPDA